MGYSSGRLYGSIAEFPPNGTPLRYILLIAIMAKPKLDQKRALTWRVLFTGILVIAAAAILARHWQTVSNSLNAARSAQLTWFLASIVLMAVTFCIAAAIYGVLALHTLCYTSTLLVEVAAAFVGRLLPAGLGGLGLNGVYLYRRGHTAAEATAVVSVNNLLGMGAHLLLLAGVLAFQAQVVRALFARNHLSLSWQVAGAVFIVIAGATAVPFVRIRIAGFAKNLLVSVRKVGAPRLLRALLLAGLLTITYTTLLLCSARALGVELGMLQVFIVFSFGTLAGTATPTPGGLVGAEAGLFAGFVAYGVSDARAGAAVLLFRLVTYWLPLLPGAFVLLAVKNRHLI